MDFGEEKQRLVAPTTEKKKRPPRKRKKKKAAGAASPMPSENGDKAPALSENGILDEAPNSVAAKDQALEPKSEDVSLKEENTSKVKEIDVAPKTVFSEKAKPEPTPRLPGVGGAAKGASSVPTPKQKKKDSWEQVGKPKRPSKPISSPKPRATSQPLGGKAPVRPGVKVATTPVRPAPQTAGTRATYKSPAGSWASKAHNPSTPQAQLSHNGSSDWRAHTLVISPRQQKSLVTPPSMATQALPSLDDFPPPGGASPAPSSAKSSPKGAWGSKSQTPRSRATQGGSAWNR